MKPVVKIDPVIISSTIHKPPASFDVRHINSDGEKPVVDHVQNSRTGKLMPLYHRIVEDYFAGDGKFDILSMIRNFPKQMLVAHGTANETVPFHAAFRTKKWIPEADLHLLEGADQKSVGIHLREKDNLTFPAQKIADRKIEFNRRNL